MFKMNQQMFTIITPIIRFSIKRLIYTLLLISSFFFLSTESIHAQEHNECSTALDLGFLQPPDPCDFPGVAPTVVSLSNIGATPSPNYPINPDCIPPNGVSSDVWVTFIASSNRINVSITINGGGFWNTAYLTLYTNGCNGLTPIDCSIGNSIFDLTEGNLYHLQIAGEDINDMEDFTLEIGSTRDCNTCVSDYDFTASPGPNNGKYASGQNIEFCYSLNSWDVSQGVNWVHAVIPKFGPGWDLSTLTPILPVNTCETSGGQWTWSEPWIATVSGDTFGPGFGFEHAGPGSNPGNDPTNPGDNFGDGCGADIDIDFCWTISTLQCLDGNTENPNNLSVDVQVYADFQSGDWTGVGCIGDDDIEASADYFLVCCPDAIPTLNIIEDESCIEGCNGSLQVIGNNTGPRNYILLDQAGNVVFADSLNSTGMSTFTGLCIGTYLVRDEDPSSSCFANSNAISFNATSITGEEYYFGCLGDGYAVTVNNVVYDQSNSNGTEILTSSTGCDSIVNIFLDFRFCSSCAKEDSISVDPLPIGQVYGPDQRVEFCYTLQRWDTQGFPFLNPLHSVIPKFGSGWDLSTLTPVLPVTTCTTTDGTWSWFESWEGGLLGSGLATYGPGFAFESIGSDNNNPGDNLGDYCTLENPDMPPLTFCWLINTKSCPSSESETDLSIQVEVFSDRQTGISDYQGCENISYVEFEFDYLLNCCEDIPPTVIILQNESCESGCNAVLQATSNNVGPRNYIWYDLDGNEIFVDNMNSTGTSIATDLCMGTYYVKDEDPATLCFANSITPIIDTLRYGEENYNGCSGDGYGVFVNGIIYNETNPSGIITLTTPDGCDSIVTIDLIFNSGLSGTEDYSGCLGDGYSVSVNNVTYDENNPSGTETLASSAGCDSIVTIDLTFQFCNGCVQNSFLTFNPSPNGGQYTGGQNVEFCFSLDSWVTQGISWVHSVIPELGPGWDLSTLTPILPVNTCPSSGGTWVWSESWIGTQSGDTFGPGFAFEHAGSGSTPGNDPNDPGDNWGDACGANIDIDFCWTVSVRECPSNGGNLTTGDDLSVSVYVYSDYSSGDWNSPSCTEADNIEASVSFLAVCCEDEAPIISVVQNPSCNGICDGILKANITISGPRNYTWFDQIGNEVFVDNLNSTGMSTATGLCQGTYYVRIDDPATFCFNNSDVITLNSDNTILNGEENYTGCEEDGYSIVVNGNIYNQNNPTGIENLVGFNGCDSIVSINLVYNASLLSEEYYEGCFGDGYSVIVNGNIYNENNPTGTETLINASGCDSIINLSLIFFPNTTEQENYVGCAGDGYNVLVNGTNYNESNPFGTETLTSSNGCDSIINVNLIFNSPINETESYNGCIGDGYNVSVNNIVYDENNPTGVQTLTSVTGCDSIVTIQLLFNEVIIESEDYQGCEGDGYNVIVNGTNYNESNPTGTETLISASGCDSVINVSLNFLPNTMGQENYVGCEGDGYQIILNGIPYNETNPTGTENLFDSNGCDSIVTVNLIYNPSISIQETYTGCAGDGYNVIVNETNYNETNPTGTETLTSSNGCDSIINVTLIFYNPINETESYNGCIGDGYNVTVNNIVYDENNPTGVQTLTSVTGCDSIVTIQLLFNEVIIESEDYQGCEGDGYNVIVNGTNYNETNPTGTETLISGGGCDSVITISLNFLPNTTGQENYIGCEGDGYQIILNGVPYNETNPTGTENLIDSNGCDSIVTVNLIYNPSISVQETYIGCAGDGYNVIINETNYNETNPTGTEILNSSNGCDSIVNINLLFNNVINETESYNGCIGDGYNVTVNGINYDENNPIGVQTLTSVTGCDSIVTIQLIFNNTISETEDYQGCAGDGYTVMVNGINYDENNPTGTETLISSGGCDSVITVNLIFDPNQNIILDPIAPLCESDSPVSLSYNPNAVSGTWSGPGVTGSNFDPSGLGSQSPVTVIFTPDTNQCAESSSIEIIVEESITNLEINGPSSFCESNTNSVQLTGTPADGTWSNNISPDGSFIPSDFGVGEFTLSYSVGDACESSTSFTFNVFSVPTVSIEATGPFLSTNNDVQTLIASPPNGTWSGDVNSDGTFIPSALGVGTFIANYSVTENSCEGSAAIDILIEMPICNLTVDLGPDTLIGTECSLILDANIPSCNTCTYLWDDGSTQAILTITPDVGSSTYSVIITDDQGCSTEDQIIVTVEDCPEALVYEPTFLIGNNSELISNDFFCIPVSVSNFEDINGVDFSINWETPSLLFTGVTNFNLQGLDIADFNTDNASNGFLNLNWTSNNNLGIDLDDNHTLFDICFQAIGAGSSTVAFGDNPIDRNVMVDPPNNPNAIECCDNLGGNDPIVNPTWANGNIQITCPSFSIEGANTECEFSTGIFAVVPSNSSTNFSWTSTQGTIVNGQGTSQIEIDWAESGTAIVCATNDCNLEECITINITAAEPEPTIIGPTDLCIGEMGTYVTAGPGFFVFYNWTTSNDNLMVNGSSTENLVEFTAVAPGPVEICVDVNEAFCAFYTVCYQMEIHDLPIIGIDSPLLFSAGNNSEERLTAFPFGGTWTGDVNPDGTFNPALLGPGSFNATYSFTTSNQCSNTADFTFNIVEALTASFAFNSSEAPSEPICIGDISEISYTGTGDSQDLFNWSFDGAEVSGNQQGNFNISWATPGSYNISLIVTDEFGFNSPEKTLAIEVVAPPEAPIINCSSSTDFIDFQWDQVSGSAGYLINDIPQSETSIDFSGLSAGEEICIDISTISDGPCDNSETIQICCTAQDCPEVEIEIDPVAPICWSSNNQITLNANITGNNTTDNLAWSGPGIADINSGIFDVALAGVGSHNITVVNTLGSCTYTDVINIQVNPIPVSNFSVEENTICQSQIININYTGNALSTAEYNWNFDGANIVSGSGNGPYQVQWDFPGVKEITLDLTENGCASTPTLQTVAVERPLETPVISCNSSTSFITFAWPPVSAAVAYEVNGISQNETVITFDGLNTGQQVCIEVSALGNGICGNSNLGQICCTTSNCPAVNIEIDPIADICLDENTSTIDLSVNIDGGSGTGNGVWSGPGIIDETLGIFDPNDPTAVIGDHLIVYTYLDGPCSYTATSTITSIQSYNSDFTINNTNAICVNETTSITYSGNAPSSALYTWDFDGGIILNGNTAGPFEVSWNTPGEKTITLSVSGNGCNAEITSQTITIETPLATPIINCAVTSNSITFDWSAIDGATGYLVNGVEQSNTTFTENNLATGESFTIQVTTIGNGTCPDSFAEQTCITPDCPAINIESPSDYCVDDDFPYLLMATPLGGTWSGDISEDGSFIPNLLGVGSFTAIYTIDDPISGCNTNQQVEFIINGLPNLDIDPIPDFCGTDDTPQQLIASPSGGMWSGDIPSDGIFSTINLGFGNNFMAVYTFTDLNTGCSNSVSQTFSIGENPTVSIQGNTDLCEGQTSALNVENGFIDYEWSNNENSASIEVSQAGTYTVTVTNEAGCSNAASIEVNVESLPLADAGMDTLVGCLIPQSGLVLNGNNSSTGDNINYSWSSVDGNIIDGANTLNPSVDEVGIYVLEVSSALGCSSTDTMMIDENLMMLEATTDDASCAGASDGSISIFASGGFPPYAYSLDGINFEDADLIENLTSGNYTVFVQDQNACIEEISNVEIVSSNSISVLLEADETVSADSKTSITSIISNATGNLQYTWTTNRTDAYLSCTDCPSPEINPVSTTTYTLNVIDEEGCEDSAEITIAVAGIFIPDGFSPHLQDGVNDFWEISGLNNFQENKLTVVNRWGDVVYSAAPYQNDWDGRGNNGKLLPHGSYYYVLKLGAGQETTHSGRVAILK